MPHDPIPALSDEARPPSIHGTGALAAMAYRGFSVAELLSFIDEAGIDASAAGDSEASRLLDKSVAHQLSFGRAMGLDLQDEALDACRLFRVRRPDSRPSDPGPSEEPPVRVLAFVAPGDLMVNTPLDFMTAYVNVRLDLLYLVPGLPLPDVVPDHDIAFCAISDCEPVALRRAAALAPRWPRPVLNDPLHIQPFSRDWLAATLAGIPGLHCPPTARVMRPLLEGSLVIGAPISAVLPGAEYPVLLRPLGSHAGHGLVKADDAADLLGALAATRETAFYLSQYADYRSPDGWFRKYRIAFVDRRPFLCHMAVSDRWMIHYLNAGMGQSEGKRADEARAMATFDTGFAARHAAAFDALNDAIGLDYYSIDCGETRDGRLLVFEADVAAIVHALDPPELYPYKLPAMQRCFNAFFELLRGRSRSTQSAAADPIAG